jgi:hypothetical protein
MADSRRLACGRRESATWEIPWCDDNATFLLAGTIRFQVEIPTQHGRDMTLLLRPSSVQIRNKQCLQQMCSCLRPYLLISALFIKDRLQVLDRKLAGVL